jgi:hypothetical protein
MVGDKTLYSYAYGLGANDAKANHITWTPITPASYSNIIATHGDVQTYGNSNNKYIQVQFTLTADHLNSNNESTYPYTIPNDDIAPATFNIDVTDLVSSGSGDISTLSIVSTGNFTGDVLVSRVDSNYSGYNTNSITTDASIKVNGTAVSGMIPIDITGITNQLRLYRYSQGINTGKTDTNSGYDSKTGNLYLSTNYELRLGTKTIIDWRDKSSNNYVNISNYVSGSSGIDINDVRLSITQASNASDSYNTGVTMTAEYLTYDSTNDRLIGYANAFLDTGTNTEQASKRVKIIMSASKKPSSGSASHSITKATGNDWTNTTKQYNFTVNNTDAGSVRLYVDGNAIMGAYANSQNELYSYETLFTISSGSVGQWRYNIMDKSYADPFLVWTDEDPPGTLDFGSNVDYIDNSYLRGIVRIHHGSYEQKYIVKMNTDSVTTGGDTPSGGSYTRTGQNFYVDEQSYDYGYDYNRSNSKVAITGYVEVDGHKVWVNSFDIGVGSIWYDGYQTGGGGSSEGVTIIDANGNERTYYGGTVYLSEIVKSSTQYGTTYAYQWGANGETPYVVSRYA